MIRIGIVDDHAIVRSALSATLSEHVDFRVVSTSANAAQALEAATGVNMDVMVMDLALPGVSGVDAIAQIRRVAPSLSVIVYSSFPEDLYGAGLVNMGVRGYVGKEREIPALIEAIRTVAQGGVYLSRQVREHAKDAEVRGGPQKHQLLSPREMEVFLKLARGAKLSEVAREMDLSVKTASTYRKRVLEKLGMTQNTEFTRYALAHHLIT